MRRLLACFMLSAFAVCTLGSDEPVAALIAQIEGSQPGTSDTAPLTIAELLSKYHVPGVSIAVIKDFRVQDRKSTRLNSSHVSISYAVFCLKKKKKPKTHLIKLYLN